MIEWGSSKSMLHFGMADTKRYDVKEWATHVVYSVNKKIKDCNSIDASPYTAEGRIWFYSSP